MKFKEYEAWVINKKAVVEPNYVLEGNGRIHQQPQATVNITRTHKIKISHKPLPSGDNADLFLWLPTFERYPGDGDLRLLVQYIRTTWIYQLSS